MKVFVKGKTIGIERQDGSTIHFTEKEAESLGLTLRGATKPFAYKSKSTRSVDDVAVGTASHHTFVALFLLHGPVETGLSLPPILARKLRDAISTQLEKIANTQSSRKVQ